MSGEKNQKWGKARRESSAISASSSSSGYPEYVPTPRVSADSVPTTPTGAGKKTMNYAMSEPKFRLSTGMERMARYKKRTMTPLPDILGIQGAPDDEVEYASFFTNLADQLVEMTGTVTAIFVNWKDQTAQVTIQTQVDRTDYGFEPGKEFLREWVNNPLFEKEGVSFRFPWTPLPGSSSMSNAVFNLKLKVPKNKVLSFLDHLAMEDGSEFIQGALVAVKFNFTTYTCYPGNTDHGVSCRLVAPVEVLNPMPNAEDSQDPDAM